MNFIQNTIDFINNTMFKSEIVAVTTSLEEYVIIKNFFSIPLPVPITISFAELQKIDFDSIKKEAEHFYNEQIRLIDEVYIKDPSCRSKIAWKGTGISVGLFILGFIVEIAASWNPTQPSSTMETLGTLLMGASVFILFKSVMIGIKKLRPTHTIEQFELWLYKNVLHVNSLMDLGDVKFRSLGLVRSGESESSEVLKIDLLRQAYSIKADALIGANVAHRAETTVSSHFNGLGAQRTIKSKTDNFYATSATAVRLN